MIDPPIAPGGGGLVVIVDDDRAIRTALARLVRTIGYPTWTCESAKDLLLEIEQIRPGCILTDVQMPGMNGLNLIKELRLRDAHMPILAMTAYPSLANRDLALAAGAQEYLTKPLDDRQLEAWLFRVIGAPRTI